MMDLYLNNQLEVLGFFERQSFAPGQVVVSTGEVHRSLYLVESGLFDVLVPSAAGSLSAALLRRGDVFGELAFFDGEPRSAEIRAAEASVALVLTRSALDRFRAKEPELAFEFAMRVGAVVSRRFRVHNRRLASLSMIGSRAVW